MRVIFCPIESSDEPNLVRTLLDASKPDAHLLTVPRLEFIVLFTLDIIFPVAVSEAEEDFRRRSDLLTLVTILLTLPLTFVVSATNSDTFLTSGNMLIALGILEAAIISYPFCQSSFPYAWPLHSLYELR